MSYIDGNTGNGRKVLTGGTVALIQAGLALALINGFAVHFIKEERPAPPVGVNIPLPPVPQPSEEPTVQPEQPVAKDTFIDTPVPPIPTPSTPPIEIAQRQQSLSAGDLTDFTFIPPVAPAEPPARFAPQSAKPRGDMAQWVTTDDYPTRDIRAGHTGAVGFRLAIDASGRVTDCTIIKSSGYAGLDDATCRNVTKRARFEAATNEAGERVAGSYSGMIRWVIPRD
ncbi:energy transducer TonB [Novosphingobium mangrovi (ex Huang et al. 2023)]|uniref:TonB family protein n=1 Tax=Novosphingobium mangrovi (ex Huang et al. 2023) TaxID=2976432 RepID=A0ABT2I190_9SPHN|nr:energy transducer TonB [Novosphingobium mangrovi (ex Huang et al. 2023)]MCT2398367.1 TonB family protein [Novosphingobium mangrovi (ex Huang et al. 2023)]